MNGYSEDGIQNAKITRTMLGVEDHGILTFMLDLDYGGSGQGFGGWVLDGKPEGPGNKRTPTNACGAIVAALLTTLGVESWEKIAGTYARARIEQGRVVAIGHLINERWCYPQKVFDALKEVSAAS